jgi:hypothetical protein
MSDDVEILYQYVAGTAWSLTDGGWTSDRAVRISTASEGSAQAAGEARGLRRFGRIIQPYESTVSDNPLPTSHPSLGRYTRLLRADAGGGITLFSKTWTAFWWGFCARIRTRYLGSAPVAVGLAEYGLTGLAGLLEQIVVIDGYDGNPSAAHPWNIYHAPAFNAGGKGNRTTATWTINSRAVHVFDHYNLGTASLSEWTIAQALDYLLDAFTLRHGGGATWTLLDSSTLGAELLPPTPVHGKTLLQVINEIANPRRGLTWKIDIDGSNRPRLVLLDWKPATGTAVDATAREWTCEIEEDTSTACDHALVVSQRAPVTTLTLDYKTSGSPRLAPDGWSFGVPPENDPNSLILRRFKISPSILDELRVELVTDVDGAYDGTRETAADIGGGPAARGAELERLTGLAADQISATVALLGDNDERSKARLFLSGPTANSWIDCSNLISIELSSRPARITLNASDAELLMLYDFLNAGGEMRVTVGVRELAEWRLSVRVADYYRGTREVVRQVGDIDEHLVTAGTAIAVSTGSPGTLVTASADVETWNGVGTPLVDELQRLSDARLRARQVKVSLSKKGLDFSTLPPATMISTVNGGPGAIQVDASVTRRSWDFTTRTTSWDTIQLADAVE